MHTYTSIITRQQHHSCHADHPWTAACRRYLLSGHTSIRKGHDRKVYFCSEPLRQALTYCDLGFNIKTWNDFAKRETKYVTLLKEFHAYFSNRLCFFWKIQQKRDLVCLQPANVSICWKWLFADSETSSKLSLSRCCCPYVIPQHQKLISSSNAR